MKALLDAMQFKQIMDGCKHAVSTDNSRPILGYIKLDIKGETITAYACDGFRLAKVVVTNTVHAASNKEEFIAYIKPLTVPKQTVDMIFPIEISKDKILAYFIGRGESEIIVNPKDLKQIKAI